MFTSRREKSASEWRGSNMNWPNDDDPIVAEIRREREEYAAKFGYDLKLIEENAKRRARELRSGLAPDVDADAKSNGALERR
jgi:hypothetical protein